MSAVYQSVAHVEDMIKKEEPLQKYYDLQEELGRCVKVTSGIKRALILLLDTSRALLQ